MPLLSVIVPAYNEESNIPILVEKVANALSVPVLTTLEHVQQNPHMLTLAILSLFYYNINFALMINIIRYILIINFKVMPIQMQIQQLKRPC